MEQKKKDSFGMMERRTFVKGAAIAGAAAMVNPLMLSRAVFGQEKTQAQIEMEKAAMEIARARAEEEKEAGRVKLILEQVDRIRFAIDDLEGGKDPAPSGAQDEPLDGGPRVPRPEAARDEGLTCDPVAGLVQIPCIERNVFAAARALDHAAFAVLSDGRHRISFDEVVEAMRLTGSDLSSRYKETALGGLAVIEKPPAD